MREPPDELIPPDDPRFEGAQFISSDAVQSYKVGRSAYLRGASWCWSAWKERPAVQIDHQTGEETPAVWDHDHCHFCYRTAFSERYDDDLRAGWATGGPAGLPTAEQRPKYHWVCPECFERYRDDFAWTVEPETHAE